VRTRTNPLTCAYVEEIVEGFAGPVLLQLPERGHLLLPQLAHRDPRTHCKSSSVRTCTHKCHTHAYTSSELQYYECVGILRRNTKVHAVCKGNKVICNHTDVMDFFRKFRSWTRPVLKNLKRNELYFSVHYYLSPIWM
jgi:hypothetical protein